MKLLSLIFNFHFLQIQKEKNTQKINQLELQLISNDRKIYEIKNKYLDDLFTETNEVKKQRNILVNILLF